VKVDHIPIDSAILGRNVLALHDVDAGDGFAALEAAYVREWAPGYAYTKIPLEQIDKIQHLERNGFQLVECQIRAAVKLRKPYDMARFGRYAFEQVRREEDLAEVLAIAATTFGHDRWKVDPSLAPGLAGSRYRHYVEQSFHDPRERVYRLLDRDTGRTLGFKTHRAVTDQEVLFLLGGIHPEFKNLGLGLINEYFEFNVLIAQGFRTGVTHLSAANYPVFNLEIGGLGFRVLTTLAVLRKVYP
jgi:hypothetical protein